MRPGHAGFVRSDTCGNGLPLRRGQVLPFSRLGESGDSPRPIRFASRESPEMELHHFVDLGGGESHRLQNLQEGFCPGYSASVDYLPEQLVTVPEILPVLDEFLEGGITEVLDPFPQYFR